MSQMISPFFFAKTVAPDQLTQDDTVGFLSLIQRAEMMGTPYLKTKTIDDLRNGAFLVSVTSMNGARAGQCLLTDVTNPKAPYVAPYPLKGKTLALTSLFMVRGHGKEEGAIPEGMGPTSTLFKEAYRFAVQNDYDTIIAKTNALNIPGRTLFERMEFTPSSPFMADNETYTSIFYVKEVGPVAP